MFTHEINLYGLTENIKRHQLKIAVIFPNSYFVGMSNLGFHKVLDLSLRREDLFVERVFFENGKMITNHLKDPLKLKDFDVIFFSISFYHDIKNVKRILEQLNFTEKKRSPVLLAGGMGVLLRPEEIINLVGYIYLGEIDNDYNKIVNLIIDWKQTGISDKEFHNNMLKIKGVADQDTYLKKDFNVLEKLTDPAHSLFLTEDTEFKNTFLIEIARFCCYKCHFCVIGSLGCFRYYPEEVILQRIEEIKRYTDRVGLVASDVLSHPGLMRIYRRLMHEGFQVSFSSFRADHLTEEFFRLYAENGNKSITIAPETGSEKLKKKINKNIPNEKIKQIAHWTAQYKLKKIKMYLLIGLPDETEEDITATIKLIKDIKDILLSYRKKNKFMPEIILSINQFVPEINTVLEDFISPDKVIIKKRVKQFKQALLKEGNIKLFFQLAGS